jgi:hypothetical protein
MHPAAGRDQLADQGVGGSEWNTMAALAGRQAEDQREMDLPGSLVAEHSRPVRLEWTANEHRGSQLVDVMDAQELR